MQTNIGVSKLLSIEQKKELKVLILVGSGAQ